MINISLRELLEAGCHFGHQVTRWNPKAAEFIYTSREDVHIIDLVKTKAALERAFEFLKDSAGNGKIIIFVGTKRQAKNILKEEAERAGVFYISERWIGGLITNWEEVKKNLDKIRTLEDNIKNVEGIYTKAEVVKFQQKLTKLLKFYGGVRELRSLPEVLFILDVKREENAVREALIAGVKTIGVVDTNSDPNVVDIAIPANDDAVGSIKIIIKLMADAVVEGKKTAEKGEVKDQKSKVKNTS
ncbi:30S ribosomal protein S2 [Candidatus Gottesmanbacteria bacterium]|nr:30S ribosomal protein S2 [Candidatus Gottesmanbacteria bacterium]